MVLCSIRNCRSKSVKGGEIKFFGFPRNESVASEWLRYCGPRTTTKYGRVCSKHFLPSDYQKPLINILLDVSPRHAKQLKEDAIPSLQLDGKQNKLNKHIEEAISENLDQSDIITEEVHSLNEEVKYYISNKMISENTNNITEVNSQNVDVSSLCEVVISDSIDSPNVNSTENRYHLCQCITMPDNQIAGSSKAYTKSNNPDVINVRRGEYESLKKTANEYHFLMSNLQKIFTPGQIRCLVDPEKRRIHWTAQDISAAFALKSVSSKGYHHLRVTVGIPLPALSTLRNWASESEIKQSLVEQVVPVKTKIVDSQPPDIATDS